MASRQTPEPLSSDSKTFLYSIAMILAVVAGIVGFVTTHDDIRARQAEVHQAKLLDSCSTSDSLDMCLVTLELIETCEEQRDAKHERQCMEQLYAETKERDEN